MKGGRKGARERYEGRREKDKEETKRNEEGRKERTKKEKKIIPTFIHIKNGRMVDRQINGERQKRKENS